ncbi:MAG: AAA family ATPase [Bdellovibrionota bacterium]|nr:AAA family ATPase [Bdellovibrionota bacterium]
MKQQKFECESCRYQFSKWQGMCTSCRKWNTIVERVLNQEHPQISNQPQKLSTIQADKFTKVEFKCGKLSKLFNDKLSTSALCLVYGEPGAGKSSLMSYVINSVGRTVLYISGEESIEQVGERLKRQGVSESKAYITSSTYIEYI